MIKMLQRLWHDRRGNALVIAGAALPLLVGSAGLATDTVQWTLWKRQLQRAADSAAIAGVYARFQSQPVNDAINNDMATNNHTYASLMAGFPTFSLPADTANSINSVQVNLAAQKVLGFSSMFMTAAPVINAAATAAAVPDGDFCAMGLDRSTTPAITIGGSSNTVLGCDAISNSTSPTGSVDINGNAYSFTAEVVAGAGGMPAAINGVEEVQAYHLAQPDPFAGKYDTSVPPGTNCRNMNQNEVNETPNDPNIKTLAPGCYSGNNQFKFTGGTINLLPGVYYLNNADFVATGGTITGNDVTIIMTGTDPGSVNLNGNATLQLRAPTTGPFAKMLFIQAANADEANANDINGSSSSFFDGAFYFPRGEVDFSGNSAASTRCVMVVGFRLTFTGNTALQNDTSGCVADQRQPGWKIRLVG